VKPIDTSTFDFPTLIQEGFVYVDKTRQIYELALDARCAYSRLPHEWAFNDEKEALLSSADAFVLPTRNENWGIAVAEAMASGLPVICTKGAPWSCLNTEQAGWWTEVSVDGLERALRELMACSDDRLLTMGANARKWVVENLAWSDIGVRMRRAYETSVG